MRRRFRLTASNTYESVSLNFNATTVAVLNPTASQVYLRIGAPDIPDESNADVIIPSPYAQTYPVVGKDFGIAIGDPTALADVADRALSGLVNVVIVEFLSEEEIVPTFGAYSFQSLSISELRTLTGFSGTVTTPVFDIGSWGGALIYVTPDAGSGQGIIQLEVSSDNVTFNAGGTWAFWPNMPVTIQVSRRLRYFRVSFGTAGIVGEPLIVGRYSVRATIAEILQTQYLVIGGSITKAYAIAALGTTSYTFITSNMPAISVGINNTGVGANPIGQVIVEASQSAAGPWRVAAEREGTLAPANLYGNFHRNFAGLDIYMRVRILDTGNTGLAGTLTMSVMPEQDNTEYLQNILSALGSIGTTPLVNQNIYAELDTIRLQTASLASSLTTIIADLASMINQLNGVILFLTDIDNNTDSIEALINSSNILLAGIQTNTNDIEVLITATNAALAAINTLITATNTALAAINTLITATNTALSNVNSQLTTIANNTGNAVVQLTSISSTLSAMNTTLGTISSTLTTIEAATRAQVTATANFIGAVTGAAGVWVNTGLVLPNDCYIQEMSVSAIIEGMWVPVGSAQVALGSAGGPAQIIQAWQGLSHFSEGPNQKYDGPRSGGIFVSSSQTNVWVQHTTCTAVRFVGSIKYRT